jgi:ElaB/YqjD/DUF883 family membrane-anchored ribosome-binding protein
MPKTTKKPNEIDEIRSDLKLLSDNVKSLSKHVEAEGKTTAADLKIKAQENLSDLKVKTQENVANFQDYSRDQLEIVEKEIKAKPAQSVAIAFGAGLLASFLLSRRG